MTKDRVLRIVKPEDDNLKGRVEQLAYVAWDYMDLKDKPANQLALAGTGLIALGTVACGSAIALVLNGRPVITTITTSGLALSGGSLIANILMTVGTTSMMAGFFAVAQKIDRISAGRETEKGDKISIFLSVGTTYAQSWALSAITERSGYYIGSVFIDSCGVMGTLGIQALVIGTLVGIYQSYCYKKEAHEMGNSLEGTKHLPLKHGVTWLSSTLLCSTAATAQWILRDYISGAAALWAASAATVTLLLSANVVVANVWERYCDRNLLGAPESIAK